MTEKISAQHIFGLHVHIETTFAVMIDRARWAMKVHQHMLSTNRWTEFCTSNGIPMDKLIKAKEPFTYSMGYWAEVAACTAFETVLGHWYYNSVGLHLNLKKSDWSELPLLVRRMGEKLSIADTEELKQLKPSIREKYLMGISFANLDIASELLGEIYSTDPFLEILGKSGKSDLRRIIDQMVSRRNSIVHRGGVDKNGENVPTSPAYIDEVDKNLTTIQKSIGRMLAWSIDWWRAELDL